MSKTYKGYELYKMIAEGKIKEKTKFKDNNEIIWRWNGVDFVCIQQGRYQDVVFAQMDFELIEDEINIQEQETDWVKVGETVGKIYTEFAKGFEEAVKQLDKNKEDKQC